MIDEIYKVADTDKWTINTCREIKKVFEYLHEKILGADYSENSFSQLNNPGAIGIVDDGTTQSLYIKSGKGTVFQVAGGIQSVETGGTGQDFSSVAAGSLIYFSDTGEMSTFAPGTVGYVLSTNATTGAPMWIDPDTLSGVGNVLFCWRSAETMVNYTGTALNPITGSEHRHFLHNFAGGSGGEEAYGTILDFKFIKIPGISTVTVWSKIWCHGEGTMYFRVALGAGTGTASIITTSATDPTWVSGSFDVSGLTNDTTYDGAISMKETSVTPRPKCSGVMLFGS